MRHTARPLPVLSLVLILPTLPEDAIGAETRYDLDLERAALEIVRDGFGARATIATPAQLVTAARVGQALPVVTDDIV
ncbi:MAG: hypothetical protein AAFN94_02390 [Pseudomonadota bacterium]